MESLRYASLGSVSSGTMRNEDLLDTLSSELEDHAQRNAAIWCSDTGRQERDAYMKLIGEAREADPDTEEASEIVQELFEALGEFAPPYAYFGAHEGDGADYGFWPLIESLEEDARNGTVLKVDDMGEVPADYAGLAMNVSDHGNVTLYQCAPGKDATELWSVV